MRRTNLQRRPCRKTYGSIDVWTTDGESIVEHVAGVEDYQVALATYHAACWLGRETRAGGF
jgi:hypothetical protein